MNRARDNEWPIQPPTPPYLPSQQTDAPDLGRMKRGSNSPTYRHPQLGNDNQLPPIRNLVPNLWEPGTSKSSQQIPSAEGENGSSVYRLRPVGPAWSGGPTNANDGHAPCPEVETQNYGSENDRDISRKIIESNKRPPPSSIEREDHARTAPSTSVTDYNRLTTSHAHDTSQTSIQTRETPDVRPRSSSETSKPTGESPCSDPQSPHQQELLRDPVGELWSWFTRGQPADPPPPFCFSTLPYGNFWRPDHRPKTGCSEDVVLAQIRWFFEVAADAFLFDSPPLFSLLIHGRWPLLHIETEILCWPRIPSPHATVHRSHYLYIYLFLDTGLSCYRVGHFPPPRTCCSPG